MNGRKILLAVIVIALVVGWWFVTDKVAGAVIETQLYQASGLGKLGGAVVGSSETGLTSSQDFVNAVKAGSPLTYAVVKFIGAVFMVICGGGLFILALLLSLFGAKSAKETAK